MIPLIFALGGIQALLVGYVVSIHNTHVVNAVRTLSPNIPYQQFPLFLSLLRQLCLLALRYFFALGLGLTPPHVTTCKDSGVVVHVRRVEGLSCKVGTPITELVVTHRDEAALLAVQGMADCEGRPKAITMGRLVGWLDTISQEEVFLPLLHPQLCPIDG